MISPVQTGPLVHASVFVRDQLVVDPDHTHLDGAGNGQYASPVWDAACRHDAVFDGSGGLDHLPPLSGTMLPATMVSGPLLWWTGVDEVSRGLAG